MKKIEMTNSRVDIYDFMRGVLICFVVLGHSKTDTIHDIVYLFHMPLFFIVSGLLLHIEKLELKEYLRNKTKALLVPYICYLLIDSFSIQNCDLSSTFKCLVYGGRALGGVYWYITCFIFSLFLLSALIKHFSDRTAKCLILVGVYSSN